MVEQSKEVPKLPELAEMSREDLEKEVKKAREVLSGDVLESAKKGGFGDWLWKNVKGVFEWIKALFGDKKKEKSPEEQAKADAKAADFGDDVEVPSTKEAAGDKLKEIEKAAKEREMQALAKLKEKKEVKSGDVVYFTYWSPENGELKCTIDLSGDAPGYKIYNRDGIGVEYQMDLPPSVTIAEIDTSGLNVDRTGKIMLVPRVGVGMLGKNLEAKPVTVEQLFALLKRMENNEPEFEVPAGNQKITFKKMEGELKTVSKNPKKTPETKGKSASFFDKLTGGAAEVGKMLSRAPELISLYWELNSKIDENEDLIEKARSSQDLQEQQKYLDKVNENVNAIKAKLKAAQKEDEPLPRVFDGLSEDLYKQRKQIAALPNGEGLFGSFKRWLFDSEKSPREKITDNIDQTVKLFGDTVDSEPGLYDDLLEVIGDSKEKIKKGAKEKAVDALMKRWEEKPLLNKLPRKVAEEVVDGVLELA